MFHNNFEDCQTKPKKQIPTLLPKIMEKTILLFSKRQIIRTKTKYAYASESDIETYATIIHCSSGKTVCASEFRKRPNFRQPLRLVVNEAQYEKIFSKRTPYITERIRIMMLTLLRKQVWDNPGLILTTPAVQCKICATRRSLIAMVITDIENLAFQQFPNTSLCLIQTAHVRVA